MRLGTSPTPAARAGRSMLAAALAVEFADELAGGTQGAALPGIGHDLALSYGQIGLLVAVPLVAGGFLELPLGVVTGQGRRRRRAVLVGGLVVVAALVAAAAARSFGALLAAFVIFFPASGAFVTLTQSGLMDAGAGRREQHMARWNLAGLAGSVTGALLLAGVLAAGGNWRDAYLAIAAATFVAWLGVLRARPRPAGEPVDGFQPPAERTAMRVAAGVVRHSGALRWAALLQISDLLLDVLTAFVALYLVDVVHATPAQAALGVAVRPAAGLAGGAALVPIAERVAGPRVLRLATLAAAVLYPAFLLVPGLVAKLLVLAALSAVTAPWYPLLEAGLYRSLHGQSGVAVSLSSAASLVGSLGPLAVGFLAGRFGQAWALAGLAPVPFAVLVLLARGTRRAPAPVGLRRE